MNIDHISVSRQQCYESCHAQYKYKYHLKVITDQETPFHFVYGKLVHRIIEEHTKSRGEKSIERVKSEIMSGKLEFENGKSAPALTNESHMRLNRNLANYMRLVDKIGFEGEIEWPFLYDLDPPNNRCLKGFLDRLIIKDGKASIIDYKTTKPGKWRKDTHNITKDLQMACYCYIVNKHFNIPAENIKAALYYLEDAKLVAVKFSEKTLQSMPEKLVKVYKEIEKSDADKVVGTVSNSCRFCDYRKICPFYSLT